MLKRNTVFVLGAGASAEYGMPLGTDLRLGVAKLLEELGKVRSGLGREPRALLQVALDSTLKLSARFGLSTERMFELANEAAGACRTARSVDQAIAWHRDDAAFTSLLKLATALEISRHDETALRHPTEALWVDTLLQLATAFPRVPLHTALGRIRVVTFNYDRLLEHLLYQRVKTGFRFNDEDAAAAMSFVHVKHVYGQCGRLPWQSEQAVGSLPCVAIGEMPCGLTLETVAKSLSTISSDGRALDESAVEDAQEWLVKAERVVFLGFSFEPMNVERLFRKQSLEGRPARSAHGTRYGMTDSDLTSVAEQFEMKRFFRSEQLVRDTTDARTKCSEFMSSYSRFLLDLSPVP